MRYLLLTLPLFVFLSCNSGKNSVQLDESISQSRDTTSGQKELNLLRDSISMPIIGIAENQKGGAVLVTDVRTYWIEKLAGWEDKYIGNPVRVWGEIEMRNDNPVFLDTSDVVSQGIPVETEKELRSQQVRYWIVNAHYELVRP